ncbi:MAG TPA: 16S rRNA (adenine(1518)-N(6)/adenine(1519)-N(6))-dimethyltransferase RsmA [Syntrophorhabdaceae bacterium]|nr:16S rRNA (adenine(1518)-N(6)/adenine(1519)-N(6))-dimethyltransferase RsmA [Syntrophorhabdaceae bacterium]
MLKKSLSQNLIKDKKILEKMVRLADIAEDDVVVEIGAGQGDFTRAICEKAGKVFAVELDTSFKDHLESLKRDQPNLRVIFADVLRVELARFAEGRKIKVLGNIPYGITGPILFKLIEERASIHSAYLTTQKEIGQRVVSLSHSRSYGALSVVCRLVADVKVLLTLKAGLFIPPPKVESTYFSMIFKDKTGHIDRAFMSFVRRCFENKRKYLRHALLKHYDEDRVAALYKALSFSPSIRAEEIEPETFVDMYERLHR